MKINVNEDFFSSLNMIFERDFRHDIDYLEKLFDSAPPIIEDEELVPVSIQNLLEKQRIKISLRKKFGELFDLHQFRLLGPLIKKVRVIVGLEEEHFINLTGEIDGSLYSRFEAGSLEPEHLGVPFIASLIRLFNIVPSLFAEILREDYAYRLKYRGESYFVPQLIQPPLSHCALKDTFRMNASVILPSTIEAFMQDLLDYLGEGENEYPDEEE